MGHVLMENGHGLVVAGRLSQASGTAEHDQAEIMVKAVPASALDHDRGDRNFDPRGFVAGLRRLRAVPHVAQNTASRRSAIDRRTTRHAGYRQSQRTRPRIEEVFAWVKTIAEQSKTRYRGLDRVHWHFTLTAAAYNLIRLPKLLGELP
jgi:hypothetical protein